MIVVVGLSHRTAPIDVRERLAVPKTELAETLAKLRARPSVAEVMVLSTCNRVEIYAATNRDAAEALAGLRQFLLDHHQ